MRDPGHVDPVDVGEVSLAVDVGQKSIALGTDRRQPCQMLCIDRRVVADCDANISTWKSGMEHRRSSFSLSDSRDERKKWRTARNRCKWCLLVILLLVSRYPGSSVDRSRHFRHSRHHPATIFYHSECAYSLTQIPSSMTIRKLALDNHIRKLHLPVEIEPRKESWVLFSSPEPGLNLSRLRSFMVFAPRYGIFWNFIAQLIGNSCAEMSF